MPLDASWLTGMTALAETLAVVPHPLAAWAVERLEPFRDRVGISPTTVTGPVAYHVGVCSWALGRRRDGLDALEQAVEISDRVGLPVFGARSRLALAERLACTGDRAGATRLAGDALAVCSALGLEGVARDAAVVLGSR